MMAARTMDSQFVRRLFVRASFAFYEGFLYWLKDKASQCLMDKAGRTLNVEVTKLLLLADETFWPNRQGKLEPASNRIAFLNYCAFVLRTAAECSDVDPAELFSESGWNDMQEPLLLRNTITHPKDPMNLVVTDAGLTPVRNAATWLLNGVVNIVNAADGRPASAGTGTECGEN